MPSTRSRWKREQALKFGATKAYATTIREAMADIAGITAGGMCKKVIVTVGEVHGKDARRLDEPHLGAPVC